MWSSISYKWVFDTHNKTPCSNKYFEIFSRLELAYKTGRWIEILWRFSLDRHFDSATNSASWQNYPRNKIKILFSLGIKVYSCKAKNVVRLTQTTADSSLIFVWKFKKWINKYGGLGKCARAAVKNEMARKMLYFDFLSDKLIEITSKTKYYDSRKA